MKMRGSRKPWQLHSVFYREPPELSTALRLNFFVNNCCLTLISFFVIKWFLQFHFNYESRWEVQGKLLKNNSNLIQCSKLAHCKKLDWFLHKCYRKKSKKFCTQVKTTWWFFLLFVFKSETIFASCQKNETLLKVCQKKWNTFRSLSKKKKHFSHFVWKSWNTFRMIPKKVKHFSNFVLGSETIFAFVGKKCNTSHEPLENKKTLFTICWKNWKIFRILSEMNFAFWRKNETLFLHLDEINHYNFPCTVSY